MLQKKCVLKRNLTKELRLRLIIIVNDVKMREGWLQKLIEECDQIAEKHCKGYRTFMN